MTPTQISNKALSQLPAASITSLDEASVQARACKEWFQQTLDLIVEKGPWRFARTVVALSGLDDSDRPKWLYRYARPAQLAMILRVYDENLSEQDYEFIGEFIYTNVLTAKVEYVSKTESSTKQTAHFRDALIWQLSANICMPITKNARRHKELLQIAEAMLERAQAFNHNENRITYADHIPEVLAGRMGLTGLENYKFPGPEEVYPDFDPVERFEDELG